MKYAVKMGSGAMMYIPSFVKIGSGIQKLMLGIHRHTDRKEIAHAYFNFGHAAACHLLEVLCCDFGTKIHVRTTKHRIALYPDNGASACFS
jgi:hypothetical protein